MARILLEPDVISARTLLNAGFLLRCSATLSGALGLLDAGCSPDFSKLAAAHAGASFGDEGGSSSAGSGGSGCLAGECAGETGHGGTAPAAAGATASAGGKPHSAGQSGTSHAAGSSAGGSSGVAGNTTTEGGGGAGAVVEIVNLPGTATADTEESIKGNSAAAGHDGNPLTRWCATDGLNGHYWTLELDATHLLSRFEVVWEYPRGLSVPASYLYTVSVSDNLETLVNPTSVVIDKTANQAVTPFQVLEFPPETRGRFVRVTVTGLPPLSAGVYWASFYEARVFGPADPGAPSTDVTP